MSLLSKWNPWCSDEYFTHISTCPCGGEMLNDVCTLPDCWYSIRREVRSLYEYSYTLSEETGEYAWKVEKTLNKKWRMLKVKRWPFVSSKVHVWEKNYIKDITFKYWEKQYKVYLNSYTLIKNGTTNIKDIQWWTTHKQLKVSYCEWISWQREGIKKNEMIQFIKDVLKEYHELI